MDYKQQKRKFERMSEKDQWKWIFKNKNKITLTLDSDKTTFTYNDEKETIVKVKADISKRCGLEFLLKGVGVEFNVA